MSKTIILAYDIGTSGVKTTIVRMDGTILDSATSTHQTFFPQPAWAEQEPEDWWIGACGNTIMLMEKHPEVREQIAAIGVSGHMLGCLPVDAKGNALRRCMIHSDARASKQFTFINHHIGMEKMYHMTGNILDPRSSLCKILWVKENEPEIYEHTSRFLQAKDYLVSRLTGNIDTTDFSDASHAQLIDIHKKDYDPDVFKELGLELIKFPSLHRGTDVVGSLSRKSAEALNLHEGIPVVAGGGDGACSNVGAGVVKPGDAYCCIGTTAWIAYSSVSPIIDPAQRIFNIMSLDGETYGVFGTIQSAGRSVQWVMDLFNEKSVKEFDKASAAIDAGSNGLIFLPYLEGERSPIFDPNAKGVFFGISPIHERRHFMRAVLEGVAFALRSVLDVYRETYNLSCIRVIGGGARSDVWRKIISNICDITVQTLTVPAEDATSLGAAIAAGVGVGLFSNIEEGTKHIAVKEQYSPEKQQTETYNKIYGIYHGLYPQLKPIYEIMAKASDS